MRAYVFLSPSDRSYYISYIVEIRPEKVDLFMVPAGNKVAFQLNLLYPLEKVD